MEAGDECHGFSASKGIHAFLALRRKRGRTTLQEVQVDSGTATTPPTKRHLQQRRAQQSSQKQQFRTSSSTLGVATTIPSPLGLPRQCSAQSVEPLTLQRSESVCLWEYFIPAPPNSIQHTYIASNCILQHSALVSALKNPACGGIELIERDFEYLREYLPASTKNRGSTRLEADLILDEANAVLLYPLASIGQADPQDAEEGLNELRACLDRIGRRYSVLWLILEEYTWTTGTVSDQLAQRASSVTRSITECNPAPPPRVNRYTGPVVPRLVSLLSNVFHTEHQSDNGIARGCETSSNDFFSSTTRTGPHSLRWGCQTRVLFASSPETAARMIRQIGDGLAIQIDETARAGLRRENDGWRNSHEWLFRSWLNSQDSTHERFLSAFQIFNPFSVQAILSLCSLREFLGMSTQQREAAVGKFTNRTVLVQFDRMLTTPLSDTSEYSAAWFQDPSLAYASGKM